MFGNLKHFAFRGGEDPHYVWGKDQGNQEDEQRHNHHNTDGDPEEVLEPWAVLLSIVVANHGGDAGRKSHEHGGHEELGVQHHGDGSHTCFSGVLEHQDVEQEGGDGNGNVVDHFRRAVGAAVKQHFFPEHRLDDVQGSFAVEGEI